MTISYLVVALDVLPDISVGLFSTSSASIHRQRAELHVTSGVQMLFTLSMFARQRFGSVLGSEVFTLANLTNSPQCSPTCARQPPYNTPSDRSNTAHRPSAHVSTRIDRNDARRIRLHMTARWTEIQVNLN